MNTRSVCIIYQIVPLVNLPFEEIEIFQQLNRDKSQKNMLE